MLIVRDTALKPFVRLVSAGLSKLAGSVSVAPVEGLMCARIAENIRETVIIIVFMYEKRNKAASALRYVWLNVRRAGQKQEE